MTQAEIDAALERDIGVAVTDFKAALSRIGTLSDYERRAVAGHARLLAEDVLKATRAHVRASLDTVGLK